MPPHDYNERAKVFVSAGRKVSRKVVRSEIDKLVDHTGRSAAALAKDLASGAITRAEFEVRMRELLKSAHIVSASVGKGGRVLMTQADWGRVGAKLKWQYGYLRKFIRKAERLSEAAIISRARSYSSAIYTSFARTFKEAQTQFVEDGNNPVRCRLVTNSQEGCEECAADEAMGWVSVDEMGEIGSRICGDFCKCDIEFEDDLNASDLEIKVKVTVGEE